MWLFLLLMLASPGRAQSGPVEAPAPSPLAPAPTSPSPGPVLPTPTTPKAPRFSKTAIGACGCSIYAPPFLVVAESTRSEDRSEVWTAETQVDGWVYGVIAVKFETPFTGAAPADLEGLLVGYLDFLKGQLGIVAGAGVGRGHSHSENAKALGVIDYWTDKDGDQWAVKGWIDEGRLAVLFIAGKGEYPWLNAQQLYLDGFRFN